MTKQKKLLYILDDVKIPLAPSVNFLLSLDQDPSIVIDLHTIENIISIDQDKEDERCVSSLIKEFFKLQQTFPGGIIISGLCLTFTKKLNKHNDDDKKDQCDIDIISYWIACIQMMLKNCVNSKVHDNAYQYLIIHETTDLRVGYIKHAYAIKLNTFYNIHYQRIPKNIHPIIGSCLLGVRRFICPLQVHIIIQYLPKHLPTFANDFKFLENLIGEAFGLETKNLMLQPPLLITTFLQNNVGFTTIAEKDHDALYNSDLNLRQCDKSMSNLLCEKKCNIKEEEKEESNRHSMFTMLHEQQELIVDPECFASFLNETDIKQLTNISETESTLKLTQKSDTLGILCSALFTSPQTFVLDLSKNIQVKESHISSSSFAEFYMNIMALCYDYPYTSFNTIISKLQEDAVKCLTSRILSGFEIHRSQLGSRSSKNANVTTFPCPSRIHIAYPKKYLYPVTQCDLTMKAATQIVYNHNNSYVNYNQNDVIAILNEDKCTDAAIKFLESSAVKQLNINFSKPIIDEYDPLSFSSETKRSFFSKRIMQLITLLVCIPLICMSLIAIIITRK